MASLFLAAIDRDFLVFAMFVLLPLFGRALRALGERAQKKQDPAKTRSGSDSGSGGKSDPAIDTAGSGQAEVDVEEVERSGRDLWRKLLEGLAEITGEEGAETQVETARGGAAPAPEESSSSAPESPRRKASRRRRDAAPKRRSALLPSEEAASPEADWRTETVGGEPSGSRDGFLADSLESRLQEAGPALGAAARESSTPGATSRPLARTPLQQAVLWSEILGKPIALRQPNDASF